MSAGNVIERALQALVLYESIFCLTSDLMEEWTDKEHHWEHWD